MTSEEDRLADELASLRLDRSSPRERAGSGRAKADEGRRRGVAGWIVGAVAVAALGVGGFYVYREGSGRIFSEDVELGAVTLMSPSQSDVTLVATGYVYARKKANVSPKVGGRLAKLNVDEGVVVKENQVIAELESADVQAQLQQLHADIASARARWSARADQADTTIRFNREKELLAKEAGTQMAFDDAKARLEAARTTLASAEADVGSVEARQKTLSVALENTKVRAPFSGTILRKLAEVGEVIAPFTLNGIVTLASLDDLEVQADVAEAQFHKVKVGTPAEIILDAFPDKRFRGQVSEVRQIVDRSKAAVTVKVKFTDDSTGVLPDMAAKVSFLTKALDAEALKAAPKLIAPADAVVDAGGRKVVFTIDDGHAKAIGVAVRGPFGEGAVELADGPTTGTRVIRRPGDRIRDGVSVKEKKK